MGLINRLGHEICKINNLALAGILSGSMLVNSGCVPLVAGAAGSYVGTRLANEDNNSNYERRKRIEEIDHKLEDIKRDQRIRDEQLAELKARLNELRTSPRISIILVPYDEKTNTFGKAGIETLVFNEGDWVQVHAYNFAENSRLSVRLNDNDRNRTIYTEEKIPEKHEMFKSFTYWSFKLPYQFESIKNYSILFNQDGTELSDKSRMITVRERN